MKTGIYQIRNLTNSKRYIGSAASKNGFKGRWSVHQHHLRNSTHANSYLQNAWSKHGEEAFVFEILETCEPSACIVREQHYLDAQKPEYNINPNANSRLGIKLSEATRRKISRAHLGKKVSLEEAERLRTLSCGLKRSKQHRNAISQAMRGENAPLAKLTSHDVLRIKALFGVIPQREIAKKFNVAESTISMIKTGKNWTHITGGV